MDSKRIPSWWEGLIPKAYTCFVEGYSLSLFKSDLFAGITVGIIALPLAMAFAIASGVGPERGLYTAIVAGLFISLFGGSRTQIGGPTGAFVVVIYGIVQRQGYEGLALATLMAGALLLVGALLGLGRLIKYIPYPLTTGFTSGIALVIFSSQIKDFLGLRIDALPTEFLPKWQAIWHNFSSLDPLTTGLSVSTLAGILLLRRFVPRVPWGVAAIFFSTLIAWALHLNVETIQSRFGSMPSTLPMPSLPALPLNWETMRTLLPDAMVIALLAGIEALLSAVVADGLAGTRHRSNAELMGQGLANIGSIFFGGIPATGAIARTAANIKTGGKTPVAGIIHVVTLFVILTTMAPVIGHIPMAALSAVLVMVAWNMSEAHRFKHLLRAPFGDRAILLTAFFLTVLVDLTTAVAVGMVLATGLFIGRVSRLSRVVPLQLLMHDETEAPGDMDALSYKQVPEEVDVYEIQGPFFFGATDYLKGVRHRGSRVPKVFILRMRKVPAIDATGMHAILEFHDQCQRERIAFLLSGVKEEVAKALVQFGLVDKIGAQNILPHIDLALQRARELIAPTQEMTKIVVANSKCEM